jgi:hypothetical protein
MTLRRRQFLQGAARELMEGGQRRHAPCQNRAVHPAPLPTLAETLPTTGLSQRRKVGETHCQKRKPSGWLLAPVLEFAMLKL